MKKRAQAPRKNQPRSPKVVSEPAGQSKDIVELILRDHKPLKKLIESLKDGETERAEKEGQFEEFVPALMAHAKSEEKSLYVHMKTVEGLRMESLEGDTEHAIAEQLIQEINRTPDDTEWNAKVKVLAELVEHHIEEEEGEMLKKIEKHMVLETRKVIGDLYTQIKMELELLNRPHKRARQKSLEHRLN